MKTKILELISKKLDSCYERDRYIYKELKKEIEEMEELLYPLEIAWKTTPPEIQKVINENFSKMI